MRHGLTEAKAIAMVGEIEEKFIYPCRMAA